MWRRSSHLQTSAPGNCVATVKSVICGRYFKNSTGRNPSFTEIHINNNNNNNISEVQNVLMLLPGYSKAILTIDNDSKILEKCMYSPLYEHFVTSLSSRQHGFVRQISTITNMLAFLQAVYKALDEDQHSDVVAFYTDFSKAFDKVSHYLLLCKVASPGVNGCLLERLHDYLSDRKQIVRVDNVSFWPKDVTSGVPQGSLLGPLLFCIFINDLPEALAFSDSYLFADDLKFLSVNLTELQVQTDLQSLEKWVNKNRMALAKDKCAKLTFQGKDTNFKLFGEPLKTETNVRDLGITLTSDLTRNMQISKKERKQTVSLLTKKKCLSICRCSNQTRTL